MVRSPPVCTSPQGVLRIDSNAGQRQAMADGKVLLRALTHGHYPGQLLPPLVLPGLSTVGYLDAHGAQDWGMEPHRNEGIEICLLETGQMDFTADHRQYRLTGGDITITRPWQLHCLGNPHLGPGRLHWLVVDVAVRRPNQKWTWPDWIMLSGAERRELTASLRHTEQCIWTATPDLLHAFHEVAACVDGYPADRLLTRLKLHVNHLLLSLLEAILDQHTARVTVQPEGQRLVEVFLEQLRDNHAMATQPWTITRMAQQCGMGTTKFSKLCRQIANSSPWDYLIQCRLHWAAQHLRASPQQSITEIALGNGFATAQYFSACFRKRYHCTPRDYRKSCLK